MFKKIIIILLIVIIVLGAGYLAYDYFFKRPGPEPEPEPEPENPVMSLLEDLRLAGGVPSQVEPATLNWFFEERGQVKDVWIRGSGFALKAVPTANSEQMEAALIDQGFELDLLNMADGTVAGLRGYQKNDLVCLVIVGFSGYKETDVEWTPSDMDKKDVEVKCGLLSQGEIPVSDQESEVAVCASDEDCLPATCCHASQCVPAGQAPDCSETMCTLECQSGTMDCGGGCICQNGQCQAVLAPLESTPTVISVEINESFMVSVDANPTTGYGWQAEFDEKYLELLSQTYQEDFHEESIVGVGGKETLLFKGLRAGETQLTLSYLRPWESVLPLEVKTYRILIIGPSVQ